MSLLELILISVGLAMDCFAVSVSLGTSQKLAWKNIFRTAFFFGLFQGVMPLIGWFIGSSFQSVVEAFDHWVAFIILALIGIKMIWQSFSPEGEHKPIDLGNLPVILSFSVATSIDALITGISFGFIEVQIVEAIILITSITFLLSVVGFRLGGLTRLISPAWAERVGGLVLIGIGLKILIQHLSSS